MVTTIKQQSQMKFFGKFLKESSHFKEEKYEIAKTFEGFGQISNFLLFLKSPRSLEDLGRFLTFFFWKLSYLAIFS